MTRSTDSGRRRDVVPLFLPDRTQELLLRAALLPGAAARDCWREWRSLVDIDRLDGGSQRLLPLVYRNLRDIVSTDPDGETLRDSYLRTWHANQMAFEAIAPVLEAFDRTGVRSMLLKGAALAVRHYGDYGLRPMEDCDVMVPAHQAGTAAGVLKGLGWMASPPREPSQFTSATQWFAHSWHFRRGADQQLDLHWHLSPECCNVAADADFWGGAVPCTVKGHEVWLLAPCDQLVHVCVHGAECFVAPSLRWVADAMVILNAEAPALDWDRLIWLAGKHRLVRSLELTLGYLHDRFEAPVPERVLHAIRSLPTTRIEDLEFRIRNRAPAAAGTLPGLLRWWGRVWWRHVEAVGLAAAIGGLPAMFQETWGLRSAWSLPGQAARRVWRTIRNTRLARRSS